MERAMQCSSICMERAMQRSSICMARAMQRGRDSGRLCRPDPTCARVTPAARSVACRTDAEVRRDCRGLMRVSENDSRLENSGWVDQGGGGSHGCRGRESRDTLMH
eukprot:351809-Chlamydomonas_euryale.AAC.8